MQQTLFADAEPATRYDTFRNKMSDLGTDKDRQTHTEVAAGDRLSQRELDEIYETGRFARKLVEKPAKDATRPKIRLLGPDENELFRPEFRFHKVIFKIQEALINARQTGGGALFLAVDDGRDINEPISYENIQGLDAIHAFDRWDLSADEYHTDLSSPKYRKPRLYNFHPNRVGAEDFDDGENQNAKIHSDRIIRFEGARVRDFRRSLYDGWAQPIIETTFETMKDLGICSQAIASAVQEFQYGVIRIQNLHKMLTERDDGRKLLRQRLLAMEESKSIVNATALDASHDEEFEQKPAHLEQAREAYRVLQQNFSYDSKMPLSMAFGQMPSGMQSQDEAGRQNYFDDIEDTRQQEIKPALIRISEVLGLASGEFSSRREVRRAVSAQFGPLDELTAPSAAEVFAQRADGHQKLVKAGVETPDEAQMRLFDDNIARRVPELFGRMDKYSGPGDDDLPDRVQEMPKEKREKWVEIFNSVFEEEDEETAFAVANSEVEED